VLLGMSAMTVWVNVALSFITSCSEHPRCLGTRTMVTG